MPRTTPTTPSKAKSKVAKKKKPTAATTPKATKSAKKQGDSGTKKVFKTKPAKMGKVAKQSPKQPQAKQSGTAITPPSDPQQQQQQNAAAPLQLPHPPVIPQPGQPTQPHHVPPPAMFPPPMATGMQPPPQPPPQPRSFFALQPGTVPMPPGAPPAMMPNPPPPLHHPYPPAAVRHMHQPQPPRKDSNRRSSGSQFADADDDKGSSRNPAATVAAGSGGIRGPPRNFMGSTYAAAQAQHQRGHPQWQTTSQQPSQDRQQQAQLDASAVPTKLNQIERHKQNKAAGIAQKKIPNKPKKQQKQQQQQPAQLAGPGTQSSAKKGTTTTAATTTTMTPIRKRRTTAQIEHQAHRAKAKGESLVEAAAQAVREGPKLPPPIMPPSPGGLGAPATSNGGGGKMKKQRTATVPVTGKAKAAPAAVPTSPSAGMNYDLARAASAAASAAAAAVTAAAASTTSPSSRAQKMALPPPTLPPPLPPSSSSAKSQQQQTKRHVTMNRQPMLKIEKNAAERRRIMLASALQTGGGSHPATTHPPVAPTPNSFGSPRTTTMVEATAAAGGKGGDGGGGAVEGNLGENAPQPYTEGQQQPLPSSPPPMLNLQQAANAAVAKGPRVPPPFYSGSAPALPPHPPQFGVARVAPPVVGGSGMPKQRPPQPPQTHATSASFVVGIARGGEGGEGGVTATVGGANSPVGPPMANPASDAGVVTETPTHKVTTASAKKKKKKKTTSVGSGSNASKPPRPHPGHDLGSRSAPPTSTVTATEEGGQQISPAGNGGRAAAPENSTDKKKIKRKRKRPVPSSALDDVAVAAAAPVPNVAAAPHPHPARNDLGPSSSLPVPSFADDDEDTETAESSSASSAASSPALLPTVAPGSPPQKKKRKKVRKKQPDTAPGAGGDGGGVAPTAFPPAHNAPNSEMDGAEALVNETVDALFLKGGVAAAPGERVGDGVGELAIPATGIIANGGVPEEGAAVTAGGVPPASTNREEGGDISKKEKAPAKRKKKGGKNASSSRRPLPLQRDASDDGGGPMPTSDQQTAAANPATQTASGIDASSAKTPVKKKRGPYKTKKRLAALAAARAKAEAAALGAAEAAAMWASSATETKTSAEAEEGRRAAAETGKFASDKEKVTSVMGGTGGGKGRGKAWNGTGETKWDGTDVPPPLPPSSQTEPRAMREAPREEHEDADITQDPLEPWRVFPSRWARPEFAAAMAKAMEEEEKDEEKAAEASACSLDGVPDEDDGWETTSTTRVIELLGEEDREIPPPSKGAGYLAADASVPGGKTPPPSDGAYALPPPSGNPSIWEGGKDDVGERAVDVGHDLGGAYHHSNKVVESVGGSVEAMAKEGDTTAATALDGGPEPSSFRTEHKTPPKIANEAVAQPDIDVNDDAAVAATEHTRIPKRPPSVPPLLRRVEMGYAFPSTLEEIVRRASGIVCAEIRAGAFALWEEERSGGGGGGSRCAATNEGGAQVGAEEVPSLDTEPRKEEEGRDADSKLKGTEGAHAQPPGSYSLPDDGGGTQSTSDSLRSLEEDGDRGKMGNNPLPPSGENLTNDEPSDFVAAAVSSGSKEAPMESVGESTNRSVERMPFGKDPREVSLRDDANKTVSLTAEVAAASKDAPEENEKRDTKNDKGARSEKEPGGGKGASSKLIGQSDIDETIIVVSPKCKDPPVLEDGAGPGDRVPDAAGAHEKEAENVLTSAKKSVMQTSCSNSDASGNAKSAPKSNGGVDAARRNTDQRPQGARDNEKLDDYSALLGAAAAIERFALDVILPSLVASGVGEGEEDSDEESGNEKDNRDRNDDDHLPRGHRVFLATLLAIREVLAINSKSFFFLQDRQRRERLNLAKGEVPTGAMAPSESTAPPPPPAVSAPGEGRRRRRDEREEDAFDAQLLATGVVLGALRRLGPDLRDPLVSAFARVVEKYDAADEEFASSLERADGRSIGVNMNGRELGREENVAWRVSFNRAREDHPIMRRQRRDELVGRRAYLERGAPARRVGHHRVSLPSPNACAVYVVERLPVSSMMAEEERERERIRVEDERRILAERRRRLSQLRRTRQKKASLFRSGPAMRERPELPLSLPVSMVEQPQQHQSSEEGNKHEIVTEESFVSTALLGAGDGFAGFEGEDSVLSDFSV